MTSITSTPDTANEMSAGQTMSDPPGPLPGIPYRAMATLVGDALEQAELITAPLARAVALDERISADPHLRRAKRLLAQLNAELSAELDALHAHTHSPARARR